MYSLIPTCQKHNPKQHNLTLIKFIISMKSKFLYRILYSSLRAYGTQIKPKVIPDESVLNDIENKVYKPRNHPGILKPKTITVPDSFVEAVENVVEDYPIKSLIEDGKALDRHLKAKLAPVEKEDIQKMTTAAKDKVLSQMKIPSEFRSEREQLRFHQTVSDRVKNILRREIYPWKPVEYNTYNSLVYLMSRAAAEYSVLVKIFGEISDRDPEFKPKSLFDFGSGVGTVTWATNFYWKHIFEYFNVDSSPEMNDLCQSLLQGGKGTKPSALKGVFHRQFLPASNTSYDLVVSAYTFLELPSRQSRLETVINLWNKTHKYLVIVEQGTNAGFKVINEIRDFILQASSSENMGHVFSPCPHDDVCPRFIINDGTPCNFQIHYFTLPVGAVSERKHEKYSYVILKKGERKSSDPQWPRVVREVLVRSKHTVCRLCTKNAELEEVIFTASKHGKNMYHCARCTKWGDLLPVKLEKPQNNEDDGQQEE